MLNLTDKSLLRLRTSMMITRLIRRCQGLDTLGATPYFFFCIPINYLDAKTNSNTTCSNTTKKLVKLFPVSTASEPNFKVRLCCKQRKKNVATTCGGFGETYTDFAQPQMFLHFITFLKRVTMNAYVKKYYPSGEAGAVA